MVLLPITRPWTMAPVIAALEASDIPRGDLIAVLDAPDCEGWIPELERIGFRVHAVATGAGPPPDTRGPVPRRERQAAMRAYTVTLVPDGELLTLDDDALVPPDVYERLSSAGTHSTGVQRSRYGSEHVGVWRDGKPLKTGAGVEPAECCGHYCLLTTGEVYRQTAVAAPGTGQMRAIPGLVVDWGCRVGHVTKGGVLWPV